MDMNVEDGFVEYTYGWIDRWDGWMNEWIFKCTEMRWVYNDFIRFVMAEIKS